MKRMVFNNIQHLSKSTSNLHKNEHPTEVIGTFFMTRPRNFFLEFKSQWFLRNLGHKPSALAISDHSERIWPWVKGSEVGGQALNNLPFCMLVLSVILKVKFYPNDPKSLGLADFVPSKIIETPTPKNFAPPIYCHYKQSCLCNRKWVSGVTSWNKMDRINLSRRSWKTLPKMG